VRCNIPFSLFYILSPLAKNYRFDTTNANNSNSVIKNMSDDTNENEIDNGEELDDEEVTLADDLLDEVSVDGAADDLLEGFGVLPDAAEDEEETKEKDELEDDTESLEDDAEDVDFDLFDDVDEL
jgi:hypothetical protein